MPGEPHPVGALVPGSACVRHPTVDPAMVAPGARGPFLVVASRPRPVGALTTATGMVDVLELRAGSALPVPEEHFRANWRRAA